MKKIFVFVIAVFLSACQFGANNLTLRKEQRHFAGPVVEPSIEITQEVEVAANSARAFLQNGKLIAIAQLDLYAVNCEIQLNTISDLPQLIAPGIFDVLAITREESPIVMNKAIIRVASLNYAWSSDSPVDIKRYYHFKLSPQDPNSKSQVRALTCRGIQDTPFNAQLPTLEQMKHASGQYILFDL